MTASGAAMHNMRSVETQKLRYSRELAAYTLQQWDTARQALENEKAGEKSSSGLSSSPKGSPKDSDRLSMTSQGIQSIDYAVRSRNASTYEGRAVTAESA